MTLIVGLNLSDKIYLAADSRLTIGDHHYDDTYKIAPIIPPVVGTVNDVFGKERIFMAIAGKAKLARFFYFEINKLIQKREVKYDIRDLYKHMTKDWCGNIINKWVNTTGIDHDFRCFLLFGGVSSEKTKILSKITLDKLVNIHQKTVSRRKVKTLSFAPNAVDLSNVITMIPDHLFNFNIETSKVEDMIVADSLLYGIDINLNRHSLLGLDFNKYEAEWGSSIARGEDLSEKDLPKALVAECELAYNRNDYNSAHLIATAIRKYFSKYKTIGGPVNIIVIDKIRSFPLRDPNETKIVDNIMYYKDNNGNWNKRISFVHNRDASAVV